MGHQCCSKQKVKRGLWSPEEDEKLLKYITTHGHGCWSAVPKLAGKSPPLPVSLTHRETRQHSLTARMISYFFFGISRIAKVWEELQAEVDQLPKARPQEGILHRGRGKDHHRCAQDLGQQVQKPNYISLKIFSFK
jgi:Myb-like DNA-binding domain